LNSLVIAEKNGLKEVIAVFNELFAEQFNTRLMGGAAEPVYIPAGHSVADAALADSCDYHRLYFREDYFSSALHESAHWCIAGVERRMKVDFGYWYNPDGRSQQQQSFFEQAETKPQALEWMFSVACGHRFRISADNLTADMTASDAFSQAVAQQAQDWCQQSSMPTRAEQFLNALAEQFEQSGINCLAQYQQAKII
jgi:elongation factor P hydroxylase